MEKRWKVELTLRDGSVIGRCCSGGGYTETLRRQTNLLIAVVSKFL
ncbi:hypothetical protein J3D43_000320 [Paenibacillus xylanexedens]|nr:hypothetical protein [Paenibacillus xylanexedens]MCP1421804.1 hypothetical protein [Paenibacillus xylanexedens]